MKFKRWLIKVTNYEYWPMWAFYFPLFFYFIFKGLFKGNLFYFTNANPGIDCFGGLFLDSKVTVDKLIPQQYRPATMVYDAPFTHVHASEFAEQYKGNFPVIVKPDNGERGVGVVKIKDIAALNSLLSHTNSTLLVQEYAPHTAEFGVFIVFDHNINRFKITSLTLKKYFTVTGNGHHTVQQLILESNRGIVFFEKLKARSEYPMDYIPGNGESLIIHTLGNHSNGTEFINYNFAINDALDMLLNKMMAGIQGVYYGRFDIKANTVEDLFQPGRFSIIEFNGIAAEPIHIYDSSVGYFNSLGAFIKQWRYLDRIATYNSKQGIAPSTFKECYRKILIKFNKTDNNREF